MKRIVEKLDSIEASCVKNLDAVGVQIYNKKFVLAMSDANTLHLVTLDIEKTFKVFVEPSYKSIEDFMYRRPDAECFLFDNKKELVQWVFDIPQSADSVGEKNAVEETKTEYNYYSIDGKHFKVPCSDSYDVTCEGLVKYAIENNILTEGECEGVSLIFTLTEEEYNKKAV